ncbi:hypothetical protein SNE510_16150 [Streptomyces sp. NE5-10]|uniref:DUF2637 domain-containing protein n=1 Tax=Streptomyces sp. NE5-10 TaxID=2759674 RepID=UPI0019061330|nr:DUF2637 domain-containing protein [Streptomyces sp. NE5-10]GHJ92096.1 hypothetical protein SNE510_16150 [Streptomyces sp. NE5-10]
MNAVQIRSAEQALSFGTWLIVCGAMLYSVLTVTPLMRAHTPDAWDWTAPILPIVVDAAVVIVVRLDSVLARLGGEGGRWPVVLRWMTGIMTLALNTADSALKKDLVGVAVHSVAPLLLIVTAETGLAYRRAITAAVTALEERERAERRRREQEARQRAEEAEEAARQRADEEARRIREQREFDAKLAREHREHEAALAREQAEREERKEQAERERIASAERAEREARERDEHEREQQRLMRERREREAAQRAEHERREAIEKEAREQRERVQRAERERAALLAAGPAQKQQEKDLALRTVAAAFAAGLPVRQAAELCGWSTGWVTGRYQELRDTHPAQALEGASR